MGSLDLLKTAKKLISWGVGVSQKKAVYRVSGKHKYEYNFDRIDLRRTWLVLGAIQNMDRPTVTSMSKQLNFGKSTVQTILENLRGHQYPGLEIHIENAVCKVIKWGILNPEIIEDFYNEYL